MIPPTKTQVRGFSLIEVLIAVVVLSFGLLALAAMQAGLFRAGAETKARSVATSFAQRQLEDLKSFVALQTGATTSYEAISTQPLTLPMSGGVEFYGCTQVRRYRFNTATGRFVRLNNVNSSITRSGGTVTVTCADTGVIAAPVAVGTSEFKEVRVTVGWFGSEAAAGAAPKTVEITDSIASVVPTDALMLANTNPDPRPGPTVWIRPPNRDSSGNIIPAVVPIGIGGDQAAASSNPKPEQFVNDVSSATLFSVQTFTGSSTDEVRLNRKLDVAATSCVCSDNGAVSSASNPAYQPTVWNGKQLGYMEPQTAQVGKKIGTANVDNADRNLRDLCTTCCRDHHDASSQPLKVDPYRPLVGGAHGHFGYEQQGGGGYNIGGGLLPVGSTTNGQYVEACRLVRVGGLMRVAVDARQNHMMVTPLNDAGSDFNQTNFITRYSSFVGDYVNYAAQNIPLNYPGPTATYPAAPLPGPTTAQLSTYSDIVTPSTISFTATGQTRKMVDFGLYVDYLTPETLEAYNCARNNDNTGACTGLGTRNPLEYIPFYAVNLANLGAWNSSKTDVATVTNVSFNNQGTQAGDGGLVTSQSNDSSTDFPVALTIKNSNSGLTNTSPIDVDDAATANLVADAQAFVKAGASTSTPDYRYIKLLPRTVETGFNNINSQLGVTINNIDCTKINASPNYWSCQYDANATSSVIINMKGFTTNSKDRQICLPTSAIPLMTPFVGFKNDGLTTEFEQFTISSLPTSPGSSYDVQFDALLDTQSCAGGLTLVVATVTP